MIVLYSILKMEVKEEDLLKLFLENNKRCHFYN